MPKQSPHTWFEKLTEGVMSLGGTNKLKVTTPHISTWEIDLERKASSSIQDERSQKIKALPWNISCPLKKKIHLYLSKKICSRS